MTTPRRIQLRRTKGWRKPEGAIHVTRPGPWGNPFKPHRTPAGWVVAIAAGYRTTRNAELAAEANTPGPFQTEIAATRAAILAFRNLHGTPGRRRSAEKYLQGKVLACWCKPGAACHADVLLEFANPSPPTTCGQQPADATAEMPHFPASVAARNAAPAAAVEIPTPPSP